MRATNTERKIKVLVADDHPVFRLGLCRLLKTESDLECVGMAADGEEAVRKACALVPDIVVLDASMPKLNGMESARQIKAAFSAIAILMVSAYNYQAYMLASIQVGASGYILKTAPYSQIISAIRTVHTGEVVFDQEAAGKILCSIAVDKGVPKTGFAALRDRELQVLQLAARGIGSKGIAVSLGISDRTVQSHLTNIFRKLGVNSRTEAVVYALKEGYLTIEDLP